MIAPSEPALPVEPAFRWRPSFPRFRATQVRDRVWRESCRWMKAGVAFRPIVAHRLLSEDRVV
jgi:hypothetical protein